MQGYLSIIVLMISRLPPSRFYAPTLLGTTSRFTFWFNMVTTQTSRNQRLTSNAAVSFAGFVVRAVLTFALTPILIHGLGDRRYGVWSLAESALAYLSLFDLGILTALVRNAARFE